MFLRRCGVLIHKYLRYNCKSNMSQSAKTIMPEKMVLYGDEASPPVRFTMMTASILNIQVDVHKIDLFKAENKTDFYTKINPIQKVPALSINDEVICDSHAIALYFCGKIKNQNLYSKDTLTRAKVDEMLFFNATSLFPVDSLIFSEYFAGTRPVRQEKILQWFSLLEYLETRLMKTKWLACDQMQLCDLCCAATISSVELLVPALQNFSLLTKWMKELEKIPCFEINRNGLQRLSSFITLADK